MKCVVRNESGWKSLALVWREEPWNRGGMAIVIHRTDPKRDYPIPKRGVLQLVWGPGAGYIGGWTAYLGINCKDRRLGGNIYNRVPIQAGVTRNANVVPYPY